MKCSQIDFLKFHIQTRSSFQQWTVCLYEMDESSSIDFGL